jgi:hypothetical protein
MTAADRQRARRARQRHGGAVLQIEVDDLAGLADVMVELKLLQQWDSEDRKAIAAALSRVVALWRQSARHP